MLCLRVQPLAAPPSTSVAVGSVRTETTGDRRKPVMLRADSPVVGELAVRRATCDDARVLTLSGVAGEDVQVSPDSLSTATQFAERAVRLGRDVYVVAPLRLAADDDAGAAALALAEQLPRSAALVAMVGRDSNAALAPPAGALVVEVSAADEAAALLVAEDIDYIGGNT